MVSTITTQSESMDFSKYMGKWVAIADGKVIAYADEPDTVMKRADEKHTKANLIFHRVTDINELWVV